MVACSLTLYRARQQQLSLLSQQTLERSSQLAYIFQDDTQLKTYTVVTDVI